MKTAWPDCFPSLQDARVFHNLVPEQQLGAAALGPRQIPSEGIQSFEDDTTKAQSSPKQSCQHPQSSLLSCHKMKLNGPRLCLQWGRVERNESAPSFVAASTCFSSTTNTCTGRHHWGTRPFRWIRHGKVTFQLIVRSCLVYGACNFRVLFRPSASALLAMTGEPRRCSSKPSSGATGEGVKYTHTQTDLGPNGYLNPELLLYARSWRWKSAPLGIITSSGHKVVSLRCYVSPWAWIVLEHVAVAIA